MHIFLDKTLDSFFTIWNISTLLAVLINNIILCLLFEMMQTINLWKQMNVQIFYPYEQ